MKLKISSILLLAVLASFSFLAFAPKDDVYTVDVTKSEVTWEGKKILWLAQRNSKSNFRNFSFQRQKINTRWICGKHDYN